MKGGLYEGGFIAWFWRKECARIVGFWGLSSAVYIYIYFFRNFWSVYILGVQYTILYITSNRDICYLEYTLNAIKNPDTLPLAAS